MSEEKFISDITIKRGIQANFYQVKQLSQGGIMTKSSMINRLSVFFCIIKYQLLNTVCSFPPVCYLHSQTKVPADILQYMNKLNTLSSMNILKFAKNSIYILKNLEIPVYYWLSFVRELFFFGSFHSNFFYNTNCKTCGAGSCNPPRAPEITSFGEVHVDQFFFPNRKFST